MLDPAGDACDQVSDLHGVEETNNETMRACVPIGPSPTLLFSSSEDPQIQPKKTICNYVHTTSKLAALSMSRESAADVMSHESYPVLFYGKNGNEKWLGFRFRFSRSRKRRSLSPLNRSLDNLTTVTEKQYFERSWKMEATRRRVFPDFIKI